jgi:hypothetical protein
MFHGTRGGRTSYARVSAIRSVCNPHRHDMRTRPFIRALHAGRLTGNMPVDPAFACRAWTADLIHPSFLENFIQQSDPCNGMLCIKTGGASLAFCCAACAVLGNRMWIGFFLCHMTACSPQQWCLGSHVLWHNPRRMDVNCLSSRSSVRFGLTVG